jgi:cathepsin L
VKKKEKKQVKMKFIIVVLAAILACASAASLSAHDDSAVWAEYKSFHAKAYPSDEAEAERRAIWTANLEMIREHNLQADLGHHSYKLGMNKYGDMTHAEFTAQMNGFNSTRTSKTASPVSGSLFMTPANVQVPDEIDWRKKGYVTPIKDQGQCGSCWAFSTVASLEGQHFKKTGNLVSLSEQNLVDCSQKFGNMGCDGGLMDQGFQYIKANHGLDTEASYPYTAQDNRCKFSANNVGATDTGFTDIPQGDEASLTAALATVGPISVAIDASQPSFQFYSSGVYTEQFCSSVMLDHGVTAVGYGTLGDKDYYIVKNSWGVSWGMEGYILMARNADNRCGIASEASYPLV